MARQKCTFKWQGKSVRLNGKAKVNVKWQDKSVRDHKCVQDKSVRLNDTAKVFV